MEIKLIHINKCVITTTLSQLRYEPKFDPILTLSILSKWPIAIS